MISSKRVYFSTGGFRELKPIDAINLFLSNGIKNIELSGGKYDSSTRVKIENLSKTKNIIVHNFFPAPKTSFVLNLASENKSIFTKSLNMIKKNIILSSLNELKIYSFHAGFLIDPKVKELGKKISYKKVQNRKKTIKKFIDRLNIISKFAISKLKYVDLLDFSLCFLKIGKCRVGNKELMFNLLPFLFNVKGVVNS